MGEKYGWTGGPMDRWTGGPVDREKTEFRHLASDLGGLQQFLSTRPPVYPSTLPPRAPLAQLMPTTACGNLLRRRAGPVCNFSRVAPGRGNGDTLGVRRHDRDEPRSDRSRGWGRRLQGPGRAVAPASPGSREVPRAPSVPIVQPRRGKCFPVTQIRGSFSLARSSASSFGERRISITFFIEPSA
jgi:hypothetical protein